MELLKLAKQFSKRHPAINGVDLYRTMQESDPTINSRPNNLGQPIFYQGDYSVWIANQYVKGNIKAGDTPELKAALTTYDKNKPQLKPIKEVRDLTELIDLVKDLSDDFKPSRCISKGEQGLEKVYEDDEWIVYIPHTFEASRKIGGDTKWCTAASGGQEKFDYYTNQGPLYVNIRKSDGEKFQFHFETNSFMDKEDRKIILKGFGFNDGIIEFYYSTHKEFKWKTIYDAVEFEFDGYRKIENNKQYNFINNTGDLLFKNEWLGYASDFVKGIAVIAKNDIPLNAATPTACYCFINLEGKQLFETWYEKAKQFSCGYAAISLNDKWNYIDYEGNYLSEEWFDFDDCGMFWDDKAVVKKDNKENLIDKNGKLLLPWMDSVALCQANTYFVKKGDKYNYLDSDNNIVSSQWLRYIYSIKKQYIGVVFPNKKHNVIDFCTGKYVFDNDMDYIYNLQDSLIIRNSNKFMMSKFDGTFMFDEWFDNFKGLNYWYMLYEKADKYFLVDSCGNIINPEGFDDAIAIRAYDVVIQKICVKLNNEWRILDYYGNLFSNETFDYAESMLNGEVIKLTKGGHSKYIDCNGFCYGKKLFEGISRESKMNNCIYAKHDGKYYRLRSLDVVEEIDKKTE